MAKKTRNQPLLPLTTQVFAWMVPGVAACAGLAALGWLLFHDPAADLVVHVPGMDGEPVESQSAESVAIGAFFAAGEGEPAPLEGSWPRFRGAASDNLCTDPTPLAERWTDDQPRALWQVTLGEGHAGAAIHRGRVYVLDYDNASKHELLRCLSLADGREIWRRGHALDIQRNHGMSRTVPAVEGDHVVTLGPKCQVMCVDATTGALRWGLDLAKDFGSDIPMWYTGQCPLVENGVAILAPAGDETLMMGVDCATGKVRWRTPNSDKLKMSHASVMPAVIAGERMYVYAALGGLVGVSAEPGREGQRLWFAPEWDRSVIAPSPLVLEDGRIFLTAGYGGGGMMLRVFRDGVAFRVETLASHRSNQGLASEHQTPVMVGDHIYGVQPNDGGAFRNQLVCISPDDARNFLWSSGRERRFGLGPYLAVDGKLLALADDGALTMLRATPEGYEELGHRKIFEGHDAWAPMAMADGRLVLRDSTRLVCLDLRKDDVP